MNRLLRIFIGISIVLLVMSVTALSCNKTGGNNANNNNSGGGGGGDNKPKPSTPAIIFTNFNAAVAEMVGDTIQLKASGFKVDLGARAFGAYDAMQAVGQATPDGFDPVYRAFDVIITGGVVGTTPATGGLVLVGPGNLANANAFSLDALNKAVTTYSADEQREGIRNTPPISAAPRTGSLLQPGWNIFGMFMNTNAPNSADQAKETNAPFAFTATTGPIGTQPIFYCVTRVTTITDGAAGNAGSVKEDTKLTGGQGASCYAGARVAGFDGKAADDWLKKPAANDFKKKFKIAVAGIRTDEKAITNLGLDGATPADKVAAFRDGITKAEMKKLTEANPSAYTNVSLEVVKGNFTYTTPTTPQTDVAIDIPTSTEVRIDPSDANNIQIKAGAFPTTAAANANVTAAIGTLASAQAGSLKKVFDIKITGGDADPLNKTTPSGGFVLVGTGNFTDITDFSGSNVGFRLDIVGTRKEGYGAGLMKTAADTGTGLYFKTGWNHYGFFMDDTAPTANNPDASPFAFTVSGGSQPFLFCRTTIPAFNYPTINTDATDTFEGGQTATCYIGSKGNVFTGTVARGWLNDTSANFKRKFKIAIGTIRTDATPLGAIGVGSTAFLRARTFDHAVTRETIANIANKYPSGFKKMSVEIVADATW